MPRDAYILTEGDDAEDLAGSDNVISFLDYFTPVGDEFGPIVMDLAVRMWPIRSAESGCLGRPGGQPAQTLTERGERSTPRQITDAVHRIGCALLRSQG